MKRRFILLPLSLICLYAILTGYSTGPGYSSIYGFTSGCGGGGCHASSATSSTTVAMQLLDASFTPITHYVGGGSYYVRITGTQTSGSFSLPKFGFQVSTVNSSSSTTGNLTAVGGTHTVTVTGIKVVEHSSPISATSGSGGAGTTYVMTIPWTAPSSGTGNVTMRGVINAVDGAGSADAGDKWNTGSAVAFELPAITGAPFQACVGNTITLSNTVSSGTWASSAVGVATVNATTGVVGGIATGTATISYTAGGSTVTQVVTVNNSPSSISGASTVCVSLSTTLTNSVAGGSWISGNTAVATIGSSSGSVLGVSAGTSIITYTIGTCSVTRTMTVIATPTLTGSTSVCLGSNTSLTPSLPGGTWSSSNTAVGTVNTSGSPGIVEGLAVGTTNISYTISSGCSNSTTVTVNPVPAAIGGTLVVCSASTVTATNSVTGGTWSTSAGSGTATVGSSSGVITGGTAGTANITYTLPGGCFTTAVVSVNPLPFLITGTAVLCANTTTTLNNTTAGGSWLSGTTSVATVGSSTGIVTPAGTSGGTSIISYVLPTGCFRSTTVTVNAISPVSGTFAVCPSGSVTLSSAPSGGTWTSGATSVATVNATTGAVGGITSGTAGITYSTAAGCSSNAVVTVNTTAPITGGSTVCAGSSLSLANSITGGTWASSTPAVGTINGSGSLTGLSAGTTGVTYTNPSGCTSTLVATVNALPAAITGSGGGTFCNSAIITASGGAGGTIYYQGTTSGGTSTATPSTSQSVSSTGTYYFRAQSSSGCWGPEAAISVTINPDPAAIGGASAVCVGATTTLTNTTPGGTWSSSATSIGTIDNTTGVAGGIAAGTTTMSYILTSTGCFATKTLTVTAAPGAVTASGGGTFCGSALISATGGTGGIIYFQGTTPGGTSTATPSASQTVSTSGTYYFRAQSAGGCWGPEGSVTVSINPNPASITGTATVCVGSTTTLATTSTGGSWSSSNGSVATVDASGVVSGILAGTANISYTFSSTGCFTVRQVTVNPLPSPLSGIAVCAGASINLSPSSGSLTYSSSNTSVGAIGTSGGFYTFNGVAAGTTTVTGTLPTGCSQSTIATVNPLPAAITGGSTVCVSSTVTLASATPGGTWSSPSSAVTVNSTSGDVTGVSAGTAAVSYILPTGCQSATVMTVNPLPSAISGTPVLCEGSSTTFTDVTPGGTWISSNTSAALVGSTSGIVTGASAGTSLISYMLTTGCFRSVTTTINPLPSVISGTASTCVGSSSTLGSSPAGGTWSSSNTAVATVSSSTGVVTGAGTGTANITYTLPTGCLRLTPVTVNPAPTAGTLSGSTSVCTGLTVTLSSSVSGGTWSSSNPAAGSIDAAGVVTGITAGTTTITYTVSGACGTVTTTTDVTVTISASAGTLSGPSEVCNGSTITLGSTVIGGTWVSGTPSVAPVGFTSGVVTGSSVGTANITYTISSSCGTATAVRTVTVNALPPAIGGTASACAGASTTLTNTASGTWSSASTSIATVDATTGVVTGVAAGTTTITFTSTAGCIATRTATIIALPAAIGGSMSICSGSTTTLTNASGAGTWISSNTSVALIGSTTGLTTGLVSGTSVISFTLTSTGCSNSAILTVNAVPAAITGTASLCVGATTTLSSTTSGGTWTSSNITVAAAGSSTGVVTGGSAGTATVTYMLPTTCRRTITVSVNPLPGIIGGTPTVCEGATTTLTNTTSGGTWASSDLSVATIGSSSGIAAGLVAGTTTITYTATTGCARTATLTVQSVPATIGGTLTVCSGATTTLTDVTPGGIWSSSSTGVASISAGGIVTGGTAGTATISYTLSTGCSATAVLTVNALPSAISGTPSVCLGGTRTLGSSPSGDTWSSSVTTVGTIDAGTGVLTGLAAGTTTVTYQLATGCMRTVTFTVNPLPTSTATAEVCAGSTTTVSGSPTGGTWSSGTTGVATAGTTSGIITGVTAGTATVTYTLPTGCTSLTLITVDPLPAAISGTLSVCAGATTTLTSTPAGGTWSTAATTIATIGSSSGAASGVSAGTTTVTYTSPAGCRRTAALTVNPLPSAGTISGATTVCISATTPLTASVTGGVWSTTTGKASVNPFGTVTGIAAGVDTIKYTVSTVCGSATAVYPMTVNPLPAAASITGSTDVCLGLTTTLSASIAGGSWVSANATVASVSATGVVTGVTIGTATLSYTVTNACGSATTTVTATVHALADAGTITGADTVCQSDTVSLTNAIAGGTWSSSNTAVAAVTATGLVIGVAPGTATIRYRASNICSADTATHVIIVKPASACGTSVNNGPDKSAGLRLFPNPARSFFTVETPIQGILVLSATDGKQISQYNLPAGATSISLPAHLAAGVYMCRFIASDGNMQIMRLVYNP